jgi:DNA-directed RNA polymerase
MSNIDSGTFDNINDFEDVMQTFPKADVFQATVAILEIKRILALDTNPALVESNLVCHQDGTCNGLQHMAAITGSRVTAEAVNCVASTWDDLPSDIYAVISDEAQTMVSGVAHDLIVKYARDMSKNPVMIVGYGAGLTTVQRNTTKFLAKHNESTEHADLIGEMYMNALESKAAAVKSFTSAITSRMEEAMANGLTSVSWVSADGFVSDIEYTDIEEHRVRAGNFNCIKPHTNVKLDEVKTRGAMAPNLIHSVDSTHLRMVVNDCNHELVTVHDSVGSHPSTYFATAESIRVQFVKVHEYDIMSEVTNSLNVEPINFVNNRRPDGYKASEALTSSYIFS